MRSFILLLMTFFPSIAFGEKRESLYTDLTLKSCKVIEKGEMEGSYTSACPGVGGYRLLVYDEDARMSVIVIDPRGKEHPLNYGKVITQSFSELGEKAEWRVVKKDGKEIPVALIIRVIAEENLPSGQSQHTHYLAVAKITKREICVTDRILGKAKANEEARRAADTSAARPCLRGLESWLRSKD